MFKVMPHSVENNLGLLGSRDLQLGPLQRGLTSCKITMVIQNNFAFKTNSSRQTENCYTPYQDISR